ncbi:hypothetical protein ACFRJ8_14910 [Arthrobacter sp. NPDC056886]|uniref:hypothetical protein n=1 Tax=Arthrobacter sp. NPDC056886 TaxID=3345960 RepID=UPI003672BAE0
MDLTESIAPKSDQLNADDLMAGPVTVTIREVAKGSPEQPVDVHLVEFPGRAYRPSKSMRRVLVSAWGAEASTYAGHRITLFRNPEITFGRDKVGGIEISHLSHIPKPLTVALTATRGKRKNFTVAPLAEVAKRDFLAEAEAANGDKATLRALWTAAKSAGEPQAVLDTIAAMVAPDEPAQV